MSVVTAPTVQRGNLAERLDLIVAPVFAGLLAIIGAAVLLYSDIDDTTRAILAPEKIQNQLVHRPHNSEIPSQIAGP